MGMGSKEVFLVKNAYYRLNDEGLRCPVASIIWKIKVPLKVRPFVRLVINKAILTLIFV